GGGVDVADIAQHPRVKFDPAERLPCAGQADFPFGSAIGVIEHRSGSPAKRDLAQVKNVGRPGQTPLPGAPRELSRPQEGPHIRPPRDLTFDHTTIMTHGGYSHDGAVSGTTGASFCDLASLGDIPTIRLKARLNAASDR